jgi:hypothetical protein
MFGFDDSWVDDMSDLCWVDDLADPGHDYFDAEDEENYELCGEET